MSERTAAAVPGSDENTIGTFPDESPSDDAVVSRVLGGEKCLFALLIRRYNQRLYRVARAALRDDAEAEDVVQESWVRVFQHLPRYARRARFSTWITRITMYESWRRARRRKRLCRIEPGGDREGGPATESISIAPDPEQETASREAAAALEAAIDALPESYRSVFVLRGVEELSTAETAECLDMSREAVRTRMHRARSLLRRELAGVASTKTGVFPFLGPRCDALRARVLTHIGAAPASGVPIRGVGSPA